MTSRQGIEAALVVVSLLCGVAGTRVPTSASYPGDRSLADPTGRWSVEWREATDKEPHRLLLRDLQNRRVSPLIEFNRGVDVLWAPDGNALAITDHGGSGYSVILVVRPHQPGNLVQVEQALVDSLGWISAIYDNGHRYFQALTWLNPQQLRFSVRAYDSQPGREYRAFFVFDLTHQKVQKATK